MDSSSLVDTIIVDRRNAPVEFKINCVNNDVVTLKGRPCELSSFSHVPQTRENQSTERSIYNCKSKIPEKIYDYDRLFKVKYDFDDKVHRCDRKHGTMTTGRLLYLDPWQEEIKKVIPTRWSAEYGKRQVKIISTEPIKIVYKSELDPPDRKCTRVGIVQSDFFNRNGIDPLKQRYQNLV